MSTGPELAIIIPTYNEAANIPILIARLESTLRGMNWEVLVVDDDSPDGTAAIVRSLGQQDARVRVVQRIGRRGLSSACIEGMLATTAPYVAVMDADLQHDETLLPQMLAQLRGSKLDVVVGSRYVAGGGVADWEARRAQMSRLATRISQWLIHADLRDPMSGFFMLRAEVLQRCVHRLSGVGFKILLDLFASHPEPLRFVELPYQFRPRQAGHSKLDYAVLWDYLVMLLQKLAGSWLPARFIGFSLIGGSGVGVHLLVLWGLHRVLGMSFIIGHSIATLVAMTTNFWLNNLLTYRDQRLSGRAWWRGWLSFVAACSIGAIANVGVARYLFQADSLWMLSALAGIVVGAVWNYAVTAVYTWNKATR